MILKTQSSKCEYVFFLEGEGGRKWERDLRSAIVTNNYIDTTSTAKWSEVFFSFFLGNCVCAGWGRGF